ncbi:putative recombination initiation defect [Trifolium repens]|nr:putative recombination initiation defect [Trifolium repens]
MKINKAADLSSISVFPPPHIYPRKTNNVSNGLQASQQHRSQPSQQSFSQGLSSQQGILSHFSQSSLDEAVTANDLRFGSQEHENSSRRFSSLPRLTYSKDESQPHNSRSSSNMLVKWNSADNKNQLSEGLENRIGIMETSLNRFAMIMDSVQSDAMQVNKGTKELNLEMEHIRQKLIAQDNSLQLMMKGQEEIKASINESLKSLSEQMSHITNIEKLQEVYMLVSAMPQLIEGSLRNLQNDLQNTTKEMQEISRSLKDTNHKDLTQPIILPPKCVSKPVITPKMHQRPANEAKMNTPAIVASKVDTGGWMPVKRERHTFTNRVPEKVQKKNQPKAEKGIRGGRNCAIVIESDEETDGSFSCFEVNAVAAKGEGNNKSQITNEASQVSQMEVAELVTDTQVAVRRSARKRLPNRMMDSFMCKGYKKQNLRVKDLFGNLTKEEEEETERILRDARRKRKRRNSMITIL